MTPCIRLSDLLSIGPRWSIGWGPLSFIQSDWFLVVSGVVVAFNIMCMYIQVPRWWQLKYFLFSPRKLGKIPILTNIFQMGWNHQPGCCFVFVKTTPEMVGFSWWDGFWVYMAGPGRFDKIKLCLAFWCFFFRCFWVKGGCSSVLQF